MPKHFAAAFPLRAVLTAGLLALMMMSGCAKKKPRARIAKPARINSVERGIASWYGHPYHGRRAANGEVYDMEKLTAAHRTLPFGTWVEVTNLDNGRKVTVRITDRGPFVHGRVIDLSKAAAREVEMIGPGIAKVRLTVVAQPAAYVASAAYAVQVGAFQDRERAEGLRRKFEREYGSAKLVARAGAPVLWRVLVGSEPTIEEAALLESRIRESGQSGFVVRLDEAGSPER